MLTAAINEQDVAVMLNCLADIHESTEIDLVEWQEIRFTLANIVGDLRSQFSNSPSTTSSQFRKRVNLDELLAEKFKDLESDRLEDTAGMKSANSIFEFHLSNSGRSTDCFVGSSEASSSVVSFKWALDHPKAWEKYEVQLCASPLEEIEKLTLEDMVHSLVLWANN